MNGNTDIKYQGRVYRSKAIVNKVQEDIKKLAFVVLAKRELNITREHNNPDKKFLGYIKPRGYMLYGDTYTEIYWKVVEKFAVRPHNLPMLWEGCLDCRRKEDEE